jgi:hypothetical protein
MIGNTASRSTATSNIHQLPIRTGTNQVISDTKMSNISALYIIIIIIINQL